MWHPPMTQAATSGGWWSATVAGEAHGFRQHVPLTAAVCAEVGPQADGRGRGYGGHGAFSMPGGTAKEVIAAMSTTP